MSPVGASPQRTSRKPGRKPEGKGSGAFGFGGGAGLAVPRAAAAPGTPAAASAAVLCAASAFFFLLASRMFSSDPFLSKKKTAAAAYGRMKNQTLNSTTLSYTASASPEPSSALRRSMSTLLKMMSVPELLDASTSSIACVTSSPAPTDIQ